MNDIERLYQTYLASQRVTTDSRAITPGCIFFAFKGERFDGNAFAQKALEQGAALCVVSDSSYAVDDRCMVVPDVLATLQALARHHRSRLTIPVVGITGTNGKTTTKELVHAVLSKRYRTAATRGNFNNHLGVPLTLLSIPADAEMAVVEMGANHPGEIAQLCAIAEPDCGLITNVGNAHLEGFGSFEGVVRTKTELYRHLAGKHGLVFVNADNERLMHEAERLATIPGLRSVIPAYAPDNPAFVPSAIEQTPLSMLTYGRSQEADIRGTLVAGHPDNETTTKQGNGSTSPYLHFYFEVDDRVYNVRTHLLGDYNFDNCMAAVAVGLHFGVEPFDIKEAIESYMPGNQRSEWKQTGRNSLYLDCYNANPSSMAAAIATFRSMDAERKMAIIGGMHELGGAERTEHERIVEQLAACGLEQCLLVGSEFDGMALPHPMRRFADTEAVRQWLRQNPVNGATILIKGSNTNRLWTLEEEL
ncbi:MAG: UDP-N-acetylmuramyl pentapeptide synthase [bacterium P3]|nr:MAG: UDP-N-acetylmuramyl pentapeptide synthase [bacterium P3]KWW42633.1 MAG: UDP-N-acetylmuramyl pentapeptide synthase [bacterium F083]